MNAPPAMVKERPLDGYFFEDYHPGQRYLHSTPRTITAGDCALYIALTGARHPLHCATTVAQSLGYPQPPVDDLLLFHIAFGKTVPDISYNAVANLGYADCRFLLPVYVGDTIRAETEIIDTRENSSGKTGVIYVRSEAFNQRGELVLRWARWVMINRRQAAATSPSSVAAPAFPEQVARENIVSPTFLTPAPTLLRDSGGQRLWEDYLPEEIIHHPAGMTIDNSDHTLATKLYQNTARVHFDQVHMKESRFQQRLIYGGHIISLCRAQSYDGLENALSILAINGGTHLAPTFAGDTIYARSQIVEKWELNANFGALRIKLDGFKNRLPGTSPASSSEHAVLSLDYTILMPRRHRAT